MSRVAAGLVAIALTGCSFIWTEKPHWPSRQQQSPDPPPVCSISYAPPMVDFLVAATSFMMSIYYVYNAAHE